MNVLIIALLIVLPGSSQDDDCGNGLPCGPVPWRVPSYPVLESPTPFPTEFYSSTPTPTPTDPESTAEPTPPPTATFTPSPTLDFDGIDDQVGDIEDIANSTDIPVILDGDDYTLEDIDNLPDTTSIWNYTAGLFSVNVGKLTFIIQWGFILMGLALVIRTGLFVLPFLAVAIGLIRKAIQFILQFVPGFG